MKTQDRGIKLGDDVRDTITGLSGVVVAITDWINGCQRIVVQPRKLHEGAPVEPCTFDVEQVKLVKSAVVKMKAAETGGPHPLPSRQPDVKR